MNPGRFEHIVGNKAIAYGTDHAVGLFLQIWKINPKISLDDYENRPDDSNLLVDKDALFDGLTIEEFQKIATEHGFMYEH